MNYRTVESLQGHTLCVGDLVGICSIGHLVGINNLKNLGGCGDTWALDQLGIDDDESNQFCQNITSDVWIDFSEDQICFKTPESLTLVVLELMRLSEEQDYHKDFDEVKSSLN